MFVDEDYFKCLTFTQRIGFKTKMETFVGGQCKLVYTDCTFKNLNEFIEEFSVIEVASERIEYVVLCKIFLHLP